jgi:hypothetical protein
MSVRLGLAKVATVVAGTALIGGGAVHYAEKSSSENPQYVKHAKVAPAAPERAKHPMASHSHAAEKVAMVPMPQPGVVEAGQGGAGGHAGAHHPKHPHGQPVPLATTTGGTAVPAPPMLLLFGAAALALVARRRKDAFAA